MKMVKNTVSRVFTPTSAYGASFFWSSCSLLRVSLRAALVRRSGDLLLLKINYFILKTSRYFIETVFVSLTLSPIKISVLSVVSVPPWALSVSSLWTMSLNFWPSVSRRLLPRCTCSSCCTRSGSPEKGKMTHWIRCFGHLVENKLLEIFSHRDDAIMRRIVGVAVIEHRHDVL